jgi:hypothetical protein
MLTAQIRVAVARRAYDQDEQQRLADLFGPAERWDQTAKSLYWTHTTVVIPPFEQRTQAGALVPCTYDFDVAIAKYFYGIERGTIPVELLFSGSIFYDNANGVLQTARINWDSEADYRLPVSVWQEMMEHYFPQSLWMRIRREAFDRLYAYKVRHAFPTWEQALNTLLDVSRMFDRSPTSATNASLTGVDMLSTSVSAGDEQ